MQLFFWILAILISLAIGYWVYRADVKRAVPYPWLTALLRTTVVFLTCLLLLMPSITINKNETRKPVIVFLQDNSQSIPVALKGDTTTYRKNAQELLHKLADDYTIVQWGFGGNITPDTLFQYNQQTTDVAAALSQAIEFYGHQNLGAVILASDGRYNQGGNPRFLDLPVQGSLYTVALGDSIAQKDLRIANVFANKTVTLNSRFEIRTDIVAQQCSGYADNIRLMKPDGTPLDNIPLQISTDRYDRSVSFTVQADREGLHHYIITVPAADGEQNIINNRRDIFVEVVSERKDILIAAQAPHPDVNAIREALKGQENYNITVRTGDQLPSGFSDYEVIILHSLPSQQNLIHQLSNASKPVWFIMGGGSNTAAFNSLQTLATLNVNPFNLQSQLAAYNPSFTAFNMPPNIHAVTDKMPPLAVPAGVIQPGPNTQVLFSSRGNNGSPLWMLQQGNTPAALLAGEGIWRWRLFEYRHFNTHEVVDEAIRQTVSFLASNANDQPFKVELPKYVWSDQEAIYFNAYLLNANNEQVNTPDVRLTLTDSAGNKQQYSMERAGNMYKLNIGLRPEGSYSYLAAAAHNGKNHTAQGSFAVQRMPLEMMQTGADYPLLYGLAQKNNGSLIHSSQIGSLYDSIKKNMQIRPVLQSVSDNIPLVDWKWYFFLILLVATAEWLLRKYWLAQ